MDFSQPFLIFVLVILILLLVFRSRIIFLRRRHVRYKMNNYPFSLLVKRENSLQGLDVSIQNISRGGMAFTCTENLPLSTIVQFTYQNSLVTGVVRYKVPVRATDPQQYRYGIMYTYFPGDLIGTFIKDLLRQGK